MSAKENMNAFEVIGAVSGIGKENEFNGKTYIELTVIIDADTTVYFTAAKEIVPSTLKFMDRVSVAGSMRGQEKAMTSQKGNNYIAKVTKPRVRSVQVVG